MPFDSVTTPAGTPVDRSLAFTAASVAVDNLTSQYAYIPSVSRYVPPYTLGFVANMQGSGTANGKVQWQQPPGVPLPQLDTTQMLTATWSTNSAADNTGTVAAGAPLQVGAAEKLLATIAVPLHNPANVVVQDIAIPAGTQSLKLVFVAPQLSISVKGKTTGIEYVPALVGTFSGASNPTYPIMLTQGIDSVLTFAITGALVTNTTVYVVAVFDTAMVNIGSVVQTLVTTPAFHSPGSAYLPSRIAASVASVVLKSATAISGGIAIYNESTANLYALLSSDNVTFPASLTQYTVKLTPGAYWEVPFYYGGGVCGIWDAANGAAMVTGF